MRRPSASANDPYQRTVVQDSVDSAGVPLVDSGAGQEQLRLSRGNAEYVQKRSSRSYFYSRALNANNCDFVKLWAAAGG